MWVEVIKRLLKDKNLRESYAQKATERAKEFDIENIIQEWKEVFGA